jgi:hypothetical protein
MVGSEAFALRDKKRVVIGVSRLSYDPLACS